MPFYRTKVKAHERDRHHRRAGCQPELKTVVPMLIAGLECVDQ